MSIPYEEDAYERYCLDHSTRGDDLRDLHQDWAMQDEAEAAARESARLAAEAAALAADWRDAA